MKKGIALGFFAFIVAAAAQAQGPDRVRSTPLLPISGGSAHFQDPSGQATFHLEYNDNASFICWNVRNLLPRYGHVAFALYLRTPSTRRRVMTFNTNTEGYVNPTTCRVFLNPQAWVEEEITVEIYAESDDGVDAPDLGGPPVLRGVFPAL